MAIELFIQPGAGNVLTNMGFSRSDLAGNMTFLGDLLGSTIALANDAGAVAMQYSYEPFGASMASGAVSSNPYQFAFHQNDGTGLYYYSARYYSPTLGRFISEDPSGIGGGPNLYEYADDQPITFEDFFRLEPELGKWIMQAMRHLSSLSWGVHTAGIVWAKALFLGNTRRRRPTWKQTILIRANRRASF
jgi:RHS repeat-associated protein